MRKIILAVPIVLALFHLMFATDGPNVWTVNTIDVGRVISLNINPTNQQIMYCGSLDSGVFKSTNGGANWFTVNTGLTYKAVQSFAIAPSNPNILYAGTDSMGGSNSGVYRSSDAGATWTLYNTGIAQKSIQAIGVSPTDPNVAYIAVFNAVANSTDGLYKTTNGGVNWTPSTTGMGTNKNILCVLVNPLNANVIYAGTSLDVGPPQAGPPHIYKTVNAGALWTEISNGLPTGTAELNPVRAMDICKSDTAILLACMFNNTTNGGAYITTNGGALWVRKVTGLITAVGNLPRGCYIRTSQEMYIGIDNATTGGVFKTTNQGDAWTNFNGGAVLSSYATRTFAIRTTPDSTLFTGVGSTTVVSPPGKGIYEYTFIPVGIHPPGSNIPTDFALRQNYPNPFNPATNVVYDIPKASFVNITVFDVSGRVVKTLVNEQKTEGTYNIIFNASSLSSGIYFYKITAGSFTATKKMILVK